MGTLRGSVFIAISLFLCATPLSAGEPLVVHVGLYENAPKIFTDSEGNPAGIFPEILAEIAGNENWTIKYHEFSWDECLQNLEAGEIDLMLDVAHSTEREKRFDFPSEEVVTSWNAIYSNKRTTIESLCDLDGKRIAVLKGSIQHKILRRMMAGFGYSPEFIETSSFEEALILTANHKVDAFAANHFFGDYFYRDYNLRKTPIVFEPAALHFVTAKGKNADLINAIKSNLKAMKSHPGSAYYRIIGKWMLHDPEPTLSPLVYGVIISISALLLLALFFILLLRWQVKEALAKHKETSKQLGLISDNLHDGFIYRIDTGKEGNLRKFLYIGAGVKSISGIPPEKVCADAGTLYRRIHPDDIENLKKREAQAVQNMSNFNIETRIVIPDGSTRWIKITAKPHRESSGRIIFDGVVLDITETKLAELRIQQSLKEKAALLMEIHHRVKNNMAVITSLLRLQSKKLETKEQAIEAFEESCGRISAMAQIHEQLYKSDDFSAIDMKLYLEQMTPKLKRSIRIQNNVEITLRVENVFLGVDTGIPCGLIINELVTNSLKHAFTNSEKGNILIDFKKLGNNAYCLIVQDDGSGMPESIDAYEPETFGLNLVHILTRQIYGNLEIERLEKGTKFAISFESQPIETGNNPAQ